MLPDTDDPVVLLSEDTWHIVAHSRRSYTAVCGKTIRERRAHTRLSNAGEENVCPRCLQKWRQDREGS